jgi:hypothetical protein
MEEEAKRNEVAEAAAEAALLGAVGLYSHAKDGKIDLRGPEVTAVFRSIAIGMVARTKNLDEVQGKLVSSILENVANTLGDEDVPLALGAKLLTTVKNASVMALLIYDQVMEVVGKERPVEEAAG